MGCPAKKNPVFIREKKNLIVGTLFPFYLFVVAVFHACFPLMFVFLLYVIAMLPDSFSPGTDLVPLMNIVTMLRILYLIQSYVLVMN
jgi:hypothetical protein